MFTLYRNAFCHATKKAIWSIINSNDPGRRKSFTRIEHRASAIGREGLVRSMIQFSPIRVNSIIVIISINQSINLYLNTVKSIRNLKIKDNLTILNKIQNLTTTNLTKTCFS